MTDPTPLEQALLTARAEGSDDLRPALGAFMNGKIIVAGAPGEQGADAEFRPLVVSNGTTGFLCTFSSTERIAAMLGPTPDNVFAEMLGIELVRVSTEGLGIAVNPGSDLGVELSPTMVTALKKTLL